MDVDDVCLNKGAIMERCIRRIHEEYAADPALEDFTHLDALTLNIERACQAAIDMAMHVVATRHLGVPQTSAGAFELLRKAHVISAELAQSLKGMTGFRNVAIHEYQTLDLAVVHWIAENGARDWVELCRSLGVTIRP